MSVRRHNKLYPKLHPRHGLLIVLAVLAVVAAACGSDEVAETTAPTQAPATTAAMQEAETPTTEAMAMEAELTDATRVPTIRFMGPSAGYESPHFEANNRMFEEWEKLGITVETNLVPDWGELLRSGRTP